jgi:hypothetical protein
MLVVCPFAPRNTRRQHLDRRRQTVIASLLSSCGLPALEKWPECSFGTPAASPPSAQPQPQPQSQSPKQQHEQQGQYNTRLQQQRPPGFNLEAHGQALVRQMLVQLRREVPAPQMPERSGGGVLPQVSPSSTK